MATPDFNRKRQILNRAKIRGVPYAEALPRITEALDLLFAEISSDRIVETFPAPQEVTAVAVRSGVLLSWARPADNLIPSLYGAEIWRADLALDSNKHFDQNSNKRILVKVTLTSSYLDEIGDMARNYVYWIRWINLDGLISQPSIAVSPAWISDTDFENRDLWLPAPHPSCDAITYSAAKSRLLVSGASRVATAGLLTLHGLGGRFVLIPDESGILEVEVKFETFTYPATTFADNDSWPTIGIIFFADFFSALGVVIGGSGLAPHKPKISLITGNVDSLPAFSVSTPTTVQLSVVPSTIAFKIRMRWRSAAGSLTLYRWGLSKDADVSTIWIPYQYSVDGGAFTDSPNAVGSDSAGDLGAGPIIGIRSFIGIIGDGVRVGGFGADVAYFKVNTGRIEVAPV